MGRRVPDGGVARGGAPWRADAALVTSVSGVKTAERPFYAMKLRTSIVGRAWQACITQANGHPMSLENIAGTIASAKHGDKARGKLCKVHVS
jgi:hypothetical protein